MPTLGLEANHRSNWNPPTPIGGILWNTQRYMKLGAVSIRPTDYSPWYMQPNGSGPVFQTFEWMEVEFKLYNRANSTYEGAATIRKYWGVPLGFTTLTTVTQPGNYSLYTRPGKLRINGKEYSGMGALFSTNTTHGVDLYFDLKYVG